MQRKDFGGTVTDNCASGHLAEVVEPKTSGQTVTEEQMQAARPKAYPQPPKGRPFFTAEHD